MANTVEVHHRTTTTTGTTNKVPIRLEKYNLKLLLQILSGLIFIISCVLITLGLLNATFIPYGPHNNTTSLVHPATKQYCNRYSGVYLGIPGLIIGPLGILLIGLLIPKPWALRLAIIHLVLCIFGFIYNTVLADTHVSWCLQAQSHQLREYYEREEFRKMSYRENANWQNKRVEYEFPERQIPLATYVIIGVKSFILINAVVQIAAYLLSAIILAIGLAFAAKKQRQPPAHPHEVESLDPHYHGHGRNVPKE